MKKEDKAIIIEQLGAKLKEYAHFYLVDVTAMNAAATSDLRRRCFKSDIKMIVVKNTLLHKALEAAEVDYSPLYPCLKGTTAVFFCNTANVPAKLIKEVSKDGIPGLKAAYAEEGFYVGADQLDVLCSRMKLSLRLSHCCSRRRRTLSRRCSLPGRPFTAFSKLWASVPSNPKQQLVKTN